MTYKRIRNIFSLVFSVSLIAALTWSNSQETFASGTHLDTTFAGNGKLATDFNSLDDQANDVAIQADGKIVVVGSSGGNFALARYNTNGTLDITFSGDGRVTTVIGNDGSGVANAVLIQSDGKIIVAGSANVLGEIQIVVARYHSTGTLDSTFNGGIAYAAFPNYFRAKATAIAIQSGGQIVAVGQVRNLVDADPHHDWALVRFMTNGLLDTSFSGDGRLTTSFNASPNSETEGASAVVIVPGGKILAAGTASEPGSDQNFALARYNTDGTPDTFFDDDGRLMTDLPGNALLNDIKIQPDGRIVAAGSNGGTPSSPAGIALARYHINGTLDNTFDSDGTVFATYQGLNRAAELVIQTDGKIVIAGGSQDFLLVRFNRDGSRDSSFGLGGFLVTDINNGSTDAANTLALQQDGKLVAAGTTRNTVVGTNNFGVARFLPNIGHPFDFDADGKTDLGIFRPGPGEWWINRSSTGATFAAQFGQASDKIVPADFTGDGKTDIAFFRPSTGSWFILRSEDSSFYSFPFGTNGDIPAPADFDGDDKADAAVFRPSNGTWYISRSAGGTTILQFGQSGDIPVPGNYDTDSKTDIAIFRVSSGQWWIQRSSAGIIAYQFGSSTDKPVPGDYTGDGVTDVAFWRPSTGAWFILRSENLSFYSFPFGTNGDIPAPGDYDGDGRFDATVFRPSNATWYSLRSTAGTLIQQFGTSTDRPIPGAFVP